MSVNPLDPLSHFDSVSTSTKWYGPFIKPLVMVVLFVLFSYATLWMGQHYVTQDKFAVYVEKQIEADKLSAREAEKRFELTQQKLETIINNQSIFSEDLKHINQTEAGLDKRIDNLDQRLIYVERHVGSDIATPTPSK
jgi:septal ring factor EnvC (AmiA/AmiB activator)